MSLIKEGNPDAKIEAVIYGQGLGLITKDVSSQSAEIQRFISNEGCIHQSMRFGDEKTKSRSKPVAARCTNSAGWYL